MFHDQVEIQHEILNNRIRLVRKDSVTVELFQYATELYNEFEKFGAIERLKIVPQLGALRIPTRISHSRFDYVILQLHFHRLAKDKLKSDVHPSYSNWLRPADLNLSALALDKDEKFPSVYDIIQMLILVLNAGHFFNTFVSSRALIMRVEDDSPLEEALCASSPDPRFRLAAKMMVENRDYLHFHFLNSLMLLDRCNQECRAICIAKELIYAYLNISTISPKLQHAFTLFRAVRNIAYFALDLQVIQNAFVLDVNNDEAIIQLIKERISHYNNRTPIIQMMEAMQKLLDDAIYNENSSAICSYSASKKLSYKIRNVQLVSSQDFFDLWSNTQSIINVKASMQQELHDSNILKITFNHSERHYADDLLYELEHTSFVKAASYDRHHGERTILIAIRKGCSTLISTAFIILKKVVSHLRRIPNIQDNDKRFLLVAKYFMYYLFGEKELIIIPSITTSDDCVYCLRGGQARVKKVNGMIRLSEASNDTKHEAEVLVQAMSLNMKNDTAVIIPASTRVMQKDNPSRELCEIDGIMIYPGRTDKQIVFVEAKNGDWTARRQGIDELTEKMKKTGLCVGTLSYHQMEKDACCEYTIN